MVRESMDFDVVIVGGGPAGLSTSIRLMQISEEKGLDLNICLLEKGSEIGAHILSGAVVDTRALDSLLPDWESENAFIQTPVIKDEMLFLLGESGAINVPNFLMPRTLMNHGNRIISLGSLCRYLGEKAEAMGVNIFPGFPAVDLIMQDDQLKGVITGDMGLDKNGDPKDGHELGYELIAKQTVFAEGCRGSLGKKIIHSFELNKNCDPQHYGIGFKEVWSIDPELHQEGLVLHTAGWPLDNHTEGGGFIYHAPNKQLYLGLIISLDYKNPNMSPYNEFQKWKTHKKIKALLKGAERISYGARALNKGGIQSIPKLTIPGGILVGCEAGFMNGAKIKGTHTAMQSGMTAAEVIVSQLQTDNSGNEIENYNEELNKTWLMSELYQARNFSPLLKKFGLMFGSPLVWIDQNVLRGRLPFTLSAVKKDHEQLNQLSDSEPITYEKYDNVTTFDRTSSIYLSGVNHEEDQPCHLKLHDSKIPISTNLPLYGEPARLYCPAGVYEVVESGEGETYFQINAQNCIHCKTCDIKDPSQNINWDCPEGAGGPNYTDM
ncbi:MAG: electron transfer flavoprotein-ubiquinone oxidoreductase [Gammaproteobacteria bacterium]|jgi:electron-transferring-flavoprotein dehydrogenase|nr:electron transfer flavoprotein-ubiquinone oxidoreductase [Gammaproteobacteria bacterium]MBQ08766.1 electron transfer flavoprotein-ubiquinone oxidoreductase [Gammaproteobacteria bacterium]MDP6146704.1 electron transfer flavoprotein-ubiquinone oxidoreductase [Gammaproteobacteria bacterium]HJL80802.1 electron transfer flavoprotein-ubiquinone oxidoreductase [Gammaproteobacteria bacterium]HJN00656.1 electron transfer flavoprotein-ubiquinone oxidoreductase [Gammaproteobacteria bacterium]|tara:strand:+ start:18802 stop:20448 length:1647 start_codon:yes stop_codon:yes gene_type:complete